MVGETDVFVLFPQIPLIQSLKPLSENTKRFRKILF